MAGTAPAAKRKQRSGKTACAPFDKKYLTLLNALRHSNKDQRLALLKTADKKLIKCICECALNVLQGIVSLKNCQKNKLKKHKNILRQLAEKSKKKKSSWKNKKRIIVQKGGSFLPFLLPPILDGLLRIFVPK